MNGKKGKKGPFIVLGILVLLIVVFIIYALIFRNSEKTYEVGKNIEEGEYVLVGKGTYKVGSKKDSNYGYYAVCTDKSCSDVNNTIINNDNVNGKAYVIVEKGQYLKTKNMKLYKIEDYKTDEISTISYNSNFAFNDYYKVGKDIMDGTYKISGDAFSYQICSKPTCKISFDNSELISIENGNGSSTIELKEGQYLVINGTKPFSITK